MIQKVYGPFDSEGTGTVARATVAMMMALKRLDTSTAP
jgi:hypothetical protein